MLQKSWTPNQPVPEAIENEVNCMRVTQSIFDDFNSMPEQHPKYTFPFLHYLTNATIIALGLIIKQSSFKRDYGQLTLKAARSLWDHCRKTWVSGKMARTVWKLNQMADATLSHPSERLQERMGDRRQNKDQSVLNGAAYSPSPIIPGSASIPRLRSQYGDQDLLARAEYTSNGARNFQNIHEPLATPARGSTRYGAERHYPIPNTSNVQNSEKAQMIDSTEHEQGEPRPAIYAFSEAGAPNKRGHFEMTWPRPHSSETIQTTLDESDVDISFPGEMIDGGMEWLQSLFVNGLDTQLPPVWD